jgi:allantoin racemase
MTNRILYINPVSLSNLVRPIEEFINTAKRADTQIDVVFLKRGPIHLEYRYYNALILTDTINRVKRAEKDGYDAAIIGCFLDPGLQEAREITNRIIVVGPGEASMFIAAGLGYRFSIIISRDKLIPQMHEIVVKYGLINRLASFESLDLSVCDLQKDKAETALRIRKAAEKAVSERLADVIILGCTIEFGFHKELQKELGIPVIDAALASLKYAEFMIELHKNPGWSYSHTYYESPSTSEIEKWRLIDQYPELKRLQF